MHTNYSFNCFTNVNLWSGLYLHPRLNVRVPAIKSLHLPLRAWLGITIAKGFPEFDRSHVTLSHYAAHNEIKFQESRNAAERGFL